MNATNDCKNIVQLFPDARLLLSSLRSVGYTLNAAISDILDNSISAKATKIEIDFIWDNTSSYILIQDNGIGMSKEDLIVSMKIGSRNPSQIRDDTDLGRFGMGMKTAAFSIGKRLTVVTKHFEKYADVCWDLDFIEKCNGDWSLITDDNSLAVTTAKEKLELSERGTVLIIECLDSLIDTTNLIKSKKGFYKSIEEMEKHVGLIFHRFIEEDDINIEICANKVQSWNPFVLNNNATQELADEVYAQNGVTSITIQPYILPHKSKFNSDDEYRKAEGVQGWMAHQGIYVYRNRRLLIYGTWFGIVKKEPSFNLARIKLDITSSCDFDWKIDIKKSKAYPPIYIMDTLEQVVAICTQASAAVYNSRGSYSKSPAIPSLEYVWEQRKNSNGKFSFYLNKKHPLYFKLTKNIGQELLPLLTAYLGLVENYSPVLQSSIIDYMQKSNKADIVDDLGKQQDILCINNYIFTFRENGYSDDEIRSTILAMKNFLYLKSEILEMLGGEK